MASPEENLREELVRFLTHIPPSRLPSRADGGHYAVALAPCCTPALKRQCEAADAALARLKLPANESLQEGQALAADEQIYLADTITPRLRRRQATLAAIDVTSCVRIFRGMITNNKGPLDQRLREAIEA